MQSKLTLLQTELPNVDLAAQHLSYSLERCSELEAWKQPTVEQLERLESLAARFARLSDLLLQRIFRLIDDVELNGASTVLDRIYRAEKRGWAKADHLIKIRELRNVIAHEYAADAMSEIYSAIIELSPSLLLATAQTKKYAQTLLHTHQSAP